MSGLKSFATLQHWKQAARRVVVGEHLVARQQELITQLRDEGHATDRAASILKELERSQAMHVAARDRIERELAQSKNKHLLLEVALFYLKELETASRGPQAQPELAEDRMGAGIE